MKVVETIAQVRELLKPYRLQKIGFVPTMGFLHKGHLSLVEQAKEDCDVVVMSIFVNPLQFGPGEDFARYPRQLEQDCRLAEQKGVDLLFAPSVQEMYPQKMLTEVVVNQVTEKLCGATRPGHFTGVSTVVSKLFHIVMPDRAYFGLKDVQQVAVVEQMVLDLSFPIEIVSMPIIREKDGLAMSSRNANLSKEEREQALILSQALQEVKTKSFQTTQEINHYIHSRIKTQPLARVDYVETLRYPELQPIVELNYESIVIAVAVFFGQTRLIDNVIYTP